MTNAYSPRSLDESYALLAEHGARAKIIAGGTDLMVLMNARQLDAREFVDIWALNELRGITEDGPAIRIGALSRRRGLSAPFRYKTAGRSEVTL
jgi:carbon-monoxide dehydrogenase medium subunit